MVLCKVDRVGRREAISVRFYDNHRIPEKGEINEGWHGNGKLSEKGLER